MYYPKFSCQLSGSREQGVGTSRGASGATTNYQLPIPTQISSLLLYKLHHFVIES
ncbi:hypothetical protein [Chroococcidiopsis sp.]|uniref:hypothetical protein n=1 Tax=Chroococcidiopsis sp. TaxID=3088168 RepID=UPI003F3B3F74